MSFILVDIGLLIPDKMINDLWVFFPYMALLIGSLITLAILYLKEANK
jgi:hypothetical protein